MTSPEKPKFPVKDCGQEIRESDLGKVIEATREYGSLSPSGEILLQTAREYLHKETDYVWKNAKIAVLGQDLQLVFVSGYQSFQLVVTLDDEDVVNAFCEEKGWKRVSQTPDDVTSVVVWGDIKGTLTDRVLSMLVKLIKKGSNPNRLIEANGIKRVQVNGLRARKPVNGNVNADLDCPDGKVSPKQNPAKVMKKSRKCIVVVTVVTSMVILLIIAFVLFYFLWLKPNNFTLTF